VSVVNTNTVRHVAVYGGQGQQAAIAQQVLDEHVISTATGRCLRCGVPGPCSRRLTALGVFFVSAELPRRVPMLSQPERLNPRPELNTGRVGLAKAALRLNQVRWFGAV